MGQQIVASGFGDQDTGGGAFVVTAQGSERLDWLASTGLAVHPSGRRLARLMRGAATDAAGGELLLYDADGVLTYRRVDELSDPHDVTWQGDRLVAVATSANRLLWLDDDGGGVVDRWIAPGTGDAWHLNCLLVDGDRLLACAFGRFDRHRAWNVPDAPTAPPTGVVFDVATGATVLGGLRRPHHPRRVDDGWVVCDSGHEALALLGPDGTRRGHVGVGGFPRGLAMTDDVLYVGVTPQRHQGATGTAAVVALDRRRGLRELWRTSLPCREVYDVVLVDDALVAGLRRGFRTNPARVADDDQLARFRAASIEPVRLWPTGDPLPAEACRTTVALDVPPVLPAGRSTRVAWTVRNHGGALLASVGSHPVHLSWRWWDAGGRRLLGEGERVKLAEPLPPGASATGWAYLEPPAGHGAVRLRASLVQELVHWFDDLDPANGFHAVVDRAVPSPVR